MSSTIFIFFFAFLSFISLVKHQLTTKKRIANNTSNTFLCQALLFLKLFNQVTRMLFSVFAENHVAKFCIVVQIGI